jgi:hypothetical protein
MYDLDSIKEALTKIAALEQDAANIRSEGMPNYPKTFGGLRALADIAARDARFALAALERARTDIAPWEKLATLLYNSWDIDTREIKLLELLTTNERYSLDSKELREMLLKTLREVEEMEWELEADESIRALKTAGFMEVERDDFEGYEHEIRNERVSIEMDYRHGHPKIEWVGYKFSFERDNTEILSGVSGEFGKLLEAVTAKQGEASTPCVGGSPTSSSGEGR